MTSKLETESEGPEDFDAIKADLEKRFPIGSKATINDPPDQTAALSGADHGKRVTVVEIPNPQVSLARFGSPNMVIVQFDGSDFKLNINTYKLRLEQTPEKMRLE